MAYWQGHNERATWALQNNHHLPWFWFAFPEWQERAPSKLVCNGSAMPLCWTATKQLTMNHTSLNSCIVQPLPPWIWAGLMICLDQMNGIEWHGPNSKLRPSEALLTFTFTVLELKTPCCEGAWEKRPHGESSPAISAESRPSPPSRARCSFWSEPRQSKQRTA